MKIVRQAAVGEVRIRQEDGWQEDYMSEIFLPPFSCQNVSASLHLSGRALVRRGGVRWPNFFPKFSSFAQHPRLAPCGSVFEVNAMGVTAVAPMLNHRC